MSKSQKFKRNLFCDDVLTRGKIIHLAMYSYVNPSHAYDCWSKPFPIPEGCK